MDPQRASASTSSDRSLVNLGVRKRVDSNPNQSSDLGQAINSNKRQRLSTFYDLNPNDSFESFISTCSNPEVPRPSAMAFPSSYGQPNSIGVGADRLPRRTSVFGTYDDLTEVTFLDSPLRRDGGLSRSLSFTAAPIHLGGSSSIGAPRSHLSRSSSFTAASRSSSPFFISDLPRLYPGPSTHSMVDLLVMAQLGTTQPGDPFPEASARHWLRNTRITLDYTPPTTSSAVSARLLGCSAENLIYFTRGNRVHYKSLNGTATDDIGQLCKLKTSQGHLRALELNVKYRTETMAIGTSKGYIQLWDVQTKKMTATWPTIKGISAMTWNGPTLTVGGAKGSVRNYDTRLPTNKVKEQSRKLIRHEAQITALSWSLNGRFLASGDANGRVFCWENGTGVPLEVGDVVQRRKKIVQTGRISAVAWCPWQPKALATGDVDGIVRLWNVNTQSASNVLEPGKIETKAVITGIHFSRRSNCPEALLTHGMSSEADPSPFHTRPRVVNALSVVAFPSFKPIAIFRLPGEKEKAIGSSILDGHGTKVIYETPEDGKINVCDVWKRREVREVRKQPSLISLGSANSSAYSLIR